MVNELVQLARGLAYSHPILCYSFVFLMSYLESFAFVGLVMPGAAFAFSVGLMAYHGILNIYYSIFAGAIGAIMADFSSFFLAKFIRDRKTFLKLYKKYSEYIKKGEEFFNKYGGISVFVGRFIGVFRPVIPFVAGLLDMKPVFFIIFSSLSGILWGISYFGSGYLVGMGISYLDFTDYKVIILLLLIILFVYVFTKRMKNNTEG